MKKETTYKPIYPYISFNGNCRHAMQFYRKCLGRETVADSLLSDPLPADMKNLILQSKLASGALVIMGPDLPGKTGLQKGNQVSLLLDCQNKKKLLALYSKLSAGSEVTQSLEHSFRGKLFAELNDPFGQQWLLFCDERNRNGLEN